MKIYFEKTGENREIVLKSKKNIKDILIENDIILESVILVKNNKICLENEVVEDSDELKILSVVSGG